MMLFTLKWSMVVNDAGRSNVQDEYKGETKSIDVNALWFWQKWRKLEKSIFRRLLGSCDHNASLFQCPSPVGNKGCGIVAGLSVLRIINEPTTANTYGWDRKVGVERNVLIFYLGDTSDMMYQSSLLRSKLQLETPWAEKTDNWMANHFNGQFKCKHKDIVTTRIVSAVCALLANRSIPSLAPRPLRRLKEFMSTPPLPMLNLKNWTLWHSKPCGKDPLRCQNRQVTGPWYCPGGGSTRIPKIQRRIDYEH